jgi:hypothetical protein
MTSPAALLRAELSERARAYAGARSLPYCVSYGEAPTVCFEEFTAKQHGNFYPASYRRILANCSWRARLDKVHTTAGRHLPKGENGWRRELDACVSSDALLMNVFCHAATLRSASVRALLGADADRSPEFGFRAQVPLGNGRFDRTEVDMRLGSLLAEAKLTEGDFQRAAKPAVSRYRDFAEVFDRERLPQSEGEFTSYQLIRGVLAAQAGQGSYCLLTDARRPDLIELWYATLQGVKILDLRLRCRVVTWQEVARAAPRGLQTFLAEKYGL